MAKQYQDRTPADIAADHAQYTDKDAVQVAEFLNAFMLKSQPMCGKDFHSHNIDMKHDRMTPNHRIEHLLSSALDWFKFGN